MYSKGLNFACPLHTWAFQQLLFQQGIDNEIINYKPVYYNDFDLKHRLTIMIGCIKVWRSKIETIRRKD